MAVRSRGGTLPIWRGAQEAGVGENSRRGGVLLIGAHASRPLFPGLMCVLKIGFFAANCPEKLPENGVIGDFYRPAKCREN
jgi:hypothetical protein